MTKKVMEDGTYIRVIPNNGAPMLQIVTIINGKVVDITTSEASTKLGIMKHAEGFVRRQLI